MCLEEEEEEGLRETDVAQAAGLVSSSGEMQYPSGGSSADATVPAGCAADGQPVPSPAYEVYEYAERHTI